MEGCMNGCTDMYSACVCMCACMHARMRVHACMYVILETRPCMALICACEPRPSWCRPRRRHGGAEHPSAGRCPSAIRAGWCYLRRRSTFPPASRDDSGYSTAQSGGTPPPRHPSSARGPTKDPAAAGTARPCSLRAGDCPRRSARSRRTDAVERADGRALQGCSSSPRRSPVVEHASS
jgi:hypothetical protein